MADNDTNHDVASIRTRSIAEALTLLGISRPTLYKMIAARKLRVFKIGRRTLVPESELQRIVSQDMGAAL
jgi:excisionase family DNA binding protein